MSEEVVTQNGGDVAVFDFGDHSGAGFKKDLDPSELSTPYLKILQAGSKQVEDMDAAKQGRTRSLAGRGGLRTGGE